MSPKPRPKLSKIPGKRVFRALFQHFGPQKWWPADSPFEVCIGAILTQNTAWTNVERAIQNLKRSSLLTAQALTKTRDSQLAALIRPSGYFNLKTQRLKSFLTYLLDAFRGSVASMRKIPTQELRHQLLSVKGIGRETADSILLYAVEKPVFVVDAYTRRVFQRHEWIQGHEDYDEIRKGVESCWKHSKPIEQTRVYNEFHALLVAVAKNYCHKSKPNCCKCPLERMLTDKAD